VECVETGGSRENATLVFSGKADAAIMQGDAVDYCYEVLKCPPFGNNQMSAYFETAWLAVNKDSGIKNVRDLKPGKQQLYVGPKGSGTQLTFQNLAKHATEGKSSWIFFTTQVHTDQYEGVDIKNAPYEEGFAEVARDKNAVALVLMGGKSEFMRKMDDKYGGSIRLVPIIAEKSFFAVKDAEGNSVYEQCSLPGDIYSHLQQGQAKTVETLCIESVVVISPKWIEKYGEHAVNAFMASWGTTHSELNNATRGVKGE